MKIDVADRLSELLEEFSELYRTGMFSKFYAPQKIEDARRLQAFLRENPKDWFSRSNLFGHVTGSGFAVDPSWERMVLVHHRKLGKWLQPGGHSEEETLPHETALREVQEETGLGSLRLFDLRTRSFASAKDPLPFDVDIHFIPDRAKEKGHFHFDVRYLFEADSTIISCSEESHEVRWFPLEEFIENSFEPSVSEAAVKILALKDSL